MSLDVDVSSNGVRSPLSRRRTQEVVHAVLRAEKIRNALVSIAFLDKRAMARLNKEHLSHSGATDVISFGFSRATNSDPVVGDIYICPDVARANAQSRGEPIRRELIRLVAHGTLHILGYDHPDDERESSEMWRKQERLVARLEGDPERAPSPGSHPARAKRAKGSVSPSGSNVVTTSLGSTASPGKRSFRRFAAQDDRQATAAQDDRQATAAQDDRK